MPGAKSAATKASAKPVGKSAAKSPAKAKSAEAKPAKAKKEVGPDDVVRQTAGSYLSGDGRFEVRQSDSNWYVVDTAQANEFGQELMHGPFGSLKEATAAIPGARDVKPLLKSTPRPVKPAPKPEKSWLDKLPANERREARDLIRALEREGMPSAEDLVRRHRNDTAPTIATRLIERHLNVLIGEQPDRDQATELVRRVVEILTNEGARARRPVPGWTLVEVATDDEPPTRRITPRP